jgi:hypothetical protein
MKEKRKLGVSEQHAALDKYVNDIRILLMISH